MGRTLITFLGYQLREKDDTPKYWDADYRFSGSEETRRHRLFAGALLPWLAENGRPVDQLLIAGTKTSMWSALSELCGIKAEDDKFFLRVFYESIDAIKPETLTQLESFLTAHLAMTVSLVLVGECQTSSEQLKVVRKLAARVPKNDRIVLDITHSFRHLPFLGLAATRVLVATRGCTLESAYYGMNDGARERGYSPVVDISGVLRLLDVAEAFSAYERSGSVQPVADVFSRDLPTLGGLAFKLDTFQLGGVNSEAQRVMNELGGVAQDDSVLSVARDALVEAVEWSKRQVKAPVRQLELAHRKLNAGAFLEATSAAVEAAVGTGELLLGRDAPTDRDQRRREGWSALWRRLSESDRAHVEVLREIRNRMIHGEGLGGGRLTRKQREAKGHLKTADALSAFLHQSIKIVAASVKKARI